MFIHLQEVIRLASISTFNFFYMNKLFFAAAALMILLNSCKKEFLELAPISNANVDNFYNTEKDFELAINGAYISLRSSGVYHDYVPLIGDLHSDNTTVGTTAGARTAFFELSEFKEQPTSSIVSAVWNNHYQGIVRCNIILERIDAVTFQNAATKSQIVGEARFLRALLYFNLVRIFGEVPLVLKEIKEISNAYSEGRTAVPQIYTAIEDDLKLAADNLPASYTGTNIGRATSGAARGILGKVYLTQKKFSEAVTVLKAVTSANTYQLLPVFADLWKPANKNNKESLFEVQFKRQAGSGTGSSYSVRFTPYLSSQALLGVATTEGGYNTPREDLMNAYKTNDLRRSVSVAAGYTDQNGNNITGLSGRHTKKFMGPYLNGQGAEDNWPVLRYADVLLMLAESLNEVSFAANGEAYTLINLVRTRAGLGALSATATDPDLRVADQQAFRLAVENERRIELAFEGHRWFDLVRTGRALPVLQSKGFNIAAYQLVLPVPQSQIDINPSVIVQNAGY
jgi:starch-binding outer membrane protein, SusD/RagB family